MNELSGIELVLHNVKLQRVQNDPRPAEGLAQVVDPLFSPHFLDVPGKIDALPATAPRQFKG